MLAFFPWGLMGSINTTDECFLVHGQLVMCYPVEPWTVSRQMVMKTMRSPFVSSTTSVLGIVVVNRVYIETSEIPQVVRVVRSREGAQTTPKWLSQKDDPVIFFTLPSKKVLFASCRDP